jgi:hypothetical protein
MIIQKVQKSSEFHQAVFDQESPKNNNLYYLCR